MVNKYYFAFVLSIATAKIGQLQIELQGNKVNRQLQVLKISEKFSYFSYYVMDIRVE